MRRGALTISIHIILTAIAMTLSSCDSKVNIEEPGQFYKYIGSDGDQWAVDMVADQNDNIYILGGSTSTSNGSQLYVVKTSAKGIVLWERKIGDPGDENPKDIELLANGNVIVVADRTDLSGEKDFVIYTLNASDGSTVGTPRIDGNAGLDDYVNSITQISDGFIVSSYSDAHSASGDFKQAFVYRYDDQLARTPPFLWTVNFSQEIVSGGYDFVPVKVVQISNDLFYTFCYTNTTLNGDATPDYNFFIYVSGQLNDLKNTLSIPGLDPNSSERLTSIRAVPPQSGSGFIMAGYTANPTSGLQDLYAVRVVQDLQFVKPSEINSILQRPPQIVTSELSPIAMSNACVYPSKSQGFLLLGDQNVDGNNNIFLTKVDNTLQGSWVEKPFVAFGGAGNDTSGAVVETSDGRILLCGTMVLGDVVGQRKVVLMNLSPNGLFGE